MATGANFRESEILEFLSASGWGEAFRTPLSADASTRRYERLRLRSQSAMLMDAPPLESAPCPVNADEETRLSLGWNAVSRLAASRLEAFMAVGDHLRAIGLSAPEILAHDIPRGLAVLEDLGDDLFARAIEKGEDERTLYAAAGEVLGTAHRKPTPSALAYPGGEWPILEYDHLALRANIDLFIDWSPRRDIDIRINDANRLRWERVSEALIERALEWPRTLCLRDTHAENLLWLPAREGDRRVGLLDYQDAVRGWGEWDMSMLLHDARRTVSPEAADAARAAYLNRTGGQAEAFDERLCVLGAINILRIMGIFSRLAIRDSKPRYDQFQPRLRHLLASVLDHPFLGELKDFVGSTAPHLLGSP